MSQTNFLIGRGELLTHEIKGPNAAWTRLRFTRCSKRGAD